MSEGIDGRWENTDVLAKFYSWKLNLYSASCLSGENSK